MSFGTFSLVDYAISNAGEKIGATTITDLDGMTAVTFQARFGYGSGGTSVRVWFQTTLDQGQTWVDIARLTFDIVSDVAVFGLSKLAADGTVITPTDGALGTDTVVNGVLGDELRVRYLVTGTYAAGTMLSVRASVS